MSSLFSDCRGFCYSVACGRTSQAAVWTASIHGMLSSIWSDSLPSYLVVYVYSLRFGNYDLHHFVLVQHLK